MYKAGKLPKVAIIATRCRVALLANALFREDKLLADNTSVKPAELVKES